MLAPSEWSLYSLDTPSGTMLMSRRTGEAEDVADDSELPPLEACTPPELSPLSYADFRIGRSETPAVDVDPTEPPSESSQQTQSSQGGAPSGSFVFSLTAGDAVWMKRKKTIEYFRTAFKLGKLADVIERWYELEKLLGFPEIVSVHCNS